MARRICLWGLPILFMLSGCGSDPEAPTAPSAPTGPLVTETFSGTVAPLGQSFHPFTVAETSDVSAHLTEAGPPSSIFMRLGLGVVNGTTCSPLTNGTVIVQAATTPQLSGSINAGSYCVLVADAGNQTGAVTYRVTVNHY